jgi:hypothetical protein
MLEINSQINPINMKRKIFMVAVLFLFGKVGTTCLNAQSFTPDVIGSAGTYVASVSGSMSWTIGEVMTETYSSGGNSFTQGFQQPDTTGILSVRDFPMENISIYPNPVADNLTIDFANAPGDHVICIYDMTGQLISQETISYGAQRMEISFGGYANGFYLLKILNMKSNVISSYKINKAE